MNLTHINPGSLPAHPAFSQGVLMEAGGGLLVVGGQNGVDSIAISVLQVAGLARPDCLVEIDALARVPANSA